MFPCLSRRRQGMAEGMAGQTPEVITNWGAVSCVQRTPENSDELDRQTALVKNVYAQMQLEVCAEVAEALAAYSLGIGVYSHPELFRQIRYLIAPTGCGKSLMAAIACGLRAHQSGRASLIVVLASKSLYLQWNKELIRLKTAIETLTRTPVHLHENVEMARFSSFLEGERCIHFVLQTHATRTSVSSTVIALKYLKNCQVVLDEYVTQLGRLTEMSYDLHHVPLMCVGASYEDGMVSVRWRNKPVCATPWRFVLPMTAYGPLARWLGERMGDQEFDTFSIKIASAIGLPFDHAFEAHLLCDVKNAFNRAMAKYDIHPLFQTNGLHTSIDVDDLVRQAKCRAEKEKKDAPALLSIVQRLGERETCAICMDRISPETMCLTACCLQMQLCTPCIARNKKPWCPLCKQPLAVALVRPEEPPATADTSAVSTIEEAVRHAIANSANDRKQLFSFKIIMQQLTLQLSKLVAARGHLRIIVVLQTDGLVPLVKRVFDATDAVCIELKNRGTAVQHATQARVNNDLRRFQQQRSGLTAILTTRHVLRNARDTALDGLDLTMLDGVVAADDSADEISHVAQLVGRLTRISRTKSSHIPFFIHVHS